MNFNDRLLAAQARAHSLLCVGLDPEPARFPKAWRGDERRLYDFCAAIVDATHDLALCFKPQVAYFSAHTGGEEQLERLMAHMARVAPQVPVILDAKRGDIGSTAEQYAREAFERYQADAVTLSPFMGGDSLEPYQRYAGKGLILLCRTSNPGGSDLQALRVAATSGGRPASPVAHGLEGPQRDQGDTEPWPEEALYERVARLAAGPWSRTGACLGLVVGATFPQEVARVRALAPRLPLLIPGVGAQGGDAQATVAAGWRPEGPIMVNSSRAILYAAQALAARAAPVANSQGAGPGEAEATMQEYAQAARAAAQATQGLLQAAKGHLQA